MNADKWRRKIKEQVVELGVFKTSYNSVIDSLAKVLEQRDDAMRQFNAEGRQLVVEKVSDRGAVNVSINPLVSLLDKLNNTSLAYWKELGLTPASFKKMTGSSVPAESKSGGLAAALASIEED